MSLSAKILAFTRRKRQVSSDNVAENFSITRQYASQILRALVKSGDLIKFGKTKGAYYIHSDRIDDADKKYTRRIKNENLDEHEVLEDAYESLVGLKELKENIRSIFDYAFSEMVNNAIEHSKSKYIEVELALAKPYLHFIVRDFGIGVFRNVKNNMGLDSELEAMQELLKGKATTQPKAHSGEGIFFTSKVADKFHLNSFGYELFINNEIDDVFFEKVDESLKGTKVEFRIQVNSSRHLSELFNEHVSDKSKFAFDKTEILIKLYTMGTIYVSRSQARRVVNRLEKFKKVILDFDKVPTVGQAFADEIFRVFQNKHPDIQIEVINTNEAVNFMIERAKSANEATS